MVLPIPATQLPNFGRRRKIDGEDRLYGGPRSCYQYKNWIWKNGKREAEDVRPLHPQDADLIKNSYWNLSTGTQTVYALTWDLDTDKADPKWLTKKGRLKWKKMRKILEKDHPEIMQYIFAELWSTSRKGIALAMAISPLEIALCVREFGNNLCKIFSIHV